MSSHLTPKGGFSLRGQETTTFPLRCRTFAKRLSDLSKPRSSTGATNISPYDVYSTTGKLRPSLNAKYDRLRSTALSKPFKTQSQIQERHKRQARRTRARWRALDEIGLGDGRSFEPESEEEDEEKDDLGRAATTPDLMQPDPDDPDDRGIQNAAYQFYQQPRHRLTMQHSASQTPRPQSLPEAHLLDGGQHNPADPTAAENDNGTFHALRFEPDATSTPPWYVQELPSSFTSTASADRPAAFKFSPNPEVEPKRPVLRGILKNSHVRPFYPTPQSNPMPHFDHHRNIRPLPPRSEASRVRFSDTDQHRFLTPELSHTSGSDSSRGSFVIAQDRPQPFLPMAKKTPGETVLRTTMANQRWGETLPSEQGTANRLSLRRYEGSASLHSPSTASELEDRSPPTSGVHPFVPQTMVTRGGPPGYSGTSFPPRSPENMAHYPAITSPYDPVVSPSPPPIVPAELLRPYHDLLRTAKRGLADLDDGDFHPGSRPDKIPKSHHISMEEQFEEMSVQDDDGGFEVGDMVHPQILFDLEEEEDVPASSRATQGQPAEVSFVRLSDCKPMADDIPISQNRRPARLRPRSGRAGKGRIKRDNLTPPPEIDDFTCSIEELAESIAGFSDEEVDSSQRCRRAVRSRSLSPVAEETGEQDQPEAASQQQSQREFFGDGGQNPFQVWRDGY